MSRFRPVEQGERYGRLVVIKSRQRGEEKVLCRCDCGAEKALAIPNLNTTKSCGCLQREKARQSRGSKPTHGMSKTNVYAVWSSMLARCRRPTCRSYVNYGARGITVCERWLVFENFYADMGEPPPGRSLDRIDNDGNYEPGNCRWATASEQARNKRANGKSSLLDRETCVNGHPTTPENIRIEPARGPVCRARMRDKARKERATKRAARLLAQETDGAAGS